MTVHWERRGAATIVHGIDPVSLGDTNGVLHDIGERMSAHEFHFVVLAPDAHLAVPGALATFLQLDGRASVRGGGLALVRPDPIHSRFYACIGPYALPVLPTVDDAILHLSHRGRGCATQPPPVGGVGTREAAIPADSWIRGKQAALEFHTQRVDSVLVCAILGSLCDEHAGQLDRAFLPHLQGPRTRVVFDVRALEGIYIDRGGEALGTLLATIEHVRRKGGAVVFAGVHERVRRLWFTLGVDSSFTEVETVDAGILRLACGDAGGVPRASRS